MNRELPCPSVQKRKKKPKEKQSESGLEKVKAQLQEKGLYGKSSKPSTSDTSTAIEERVQQRLAALSTQREAKLSALEHDDDEQQETQVEKTTKTTVASSPHGHSSPVHLNSPGSDSVSISESDFQPQTTNKDKLRADIRAKWKQTETERENSGQVATVKEANDEMDIGEESMSRDSDNPPLQKDTKSSENKLTDSGLLRAELGMGESSEQTQEKHQVPFSYQSPHSYETQFYTSTFACGSTSQAESIPAASGANLTISKNDAEKSITVSRPESAVVEEESEGYSDDFQESEGSEGNENMGKETKRPSTTVSSSTASAESYIASPSPPPPPDDNVSKESALVGESPVSSAGSMAKSTIEEHHVAADAHGGNGQEAASVSERSNSAVPRDIVSSDNHRSPVSSAIAAAVKTTGTYHTTSTAVTSSAIHARPPPSGVHRETLPAVTKDGNSPAVPSKLEKNWEHAPASTRIQPTPEDTANEALVASLKAAMTSTLTHTRPTSSGIHQEPATTSDRNSPAVPSGKHERSWECAPYSSRVHSTSEDTANEALAASLRAAHLVPPGKIKMDDAENKYPLTVQGITDMTTSNASAKRMEETIKRYAADNENKDQIISSLQGKIQALEVEMSNMGQQWWHGQQMRDDNYRYEALLESMKEIIRNGLGEDKEHRVEGILSELTGELKVLETLMQGYQRENERLHERFKAEVNRANSLAEELDNRGRKFNFGKDVALSPDESKSEVANRLSKELEIAKREEKLREEMDKLLAEKDNLLTRLDNMQRQKKDIESEFQALQNSRIEEESTEIKRLKSEISYLKSSNGRTVQALQAKLDWYRENQALLDSDYMELQRLRKRVREFESSQSQTQQSGSNTNEVQLRKRISQLEKALKTAEESLQKRNPDSVANLVREAQSGSDSPLAHQVKDLQKQLEEERKLRDENSEENSRKLKSLRQEHEKVVNRLKKKNSELSESLKKAEERLKKYEADPSTGNSGKNGKSSWQQRAKDAENEVKKVREFYQTKMKKLQGKMNSKAPTKDSEKQISQLSESNSSEPLEREKAINESHGETQQGNEQNLPATSQNSNPRENDESQPEAQRSKTDTSEEHSLGAFKQFVAENSTVSLLKEQVDSLKQKCNELEEQNKAIQASYNDLSNQLSSTRGENDFLKKQNDSLLRRLEEYSDSNSAVSLRKAVLDLEQKLEEREKRLAHAEGSLREEAAHEVNRVKREYSALLETRTQQLRDLEDQFRRIQAYVLKLTGKDPNSEDYQKVPQNTSDYTVDDILASYSGVI